MIAGRRTASPPLPGRVEAQRQPGAPLRIPPGRDLGGNGVDDAGLRRLLVDNPARAFVFA
jgi:hypothetical protein